MLRSEGKKGIYCLVLAPTRELAMQIRETFDSLGTTIGLRTACIVGGIDMMTQAIALQKKPHVIVGECTSLLSCQVAIYISHATTAT